MYYVMRSKMSESFKILRIHKSTEGLNWLIKVSLLLSFSGKENFSKVG